MDISKARSSCTCITDMDDYFYRKRKRRTNEIPCEMNL